MASFIEVLEQTNESDIVSRKLEELQKRFDELNKIKNQNPALANQISKVSGGADAEINGLKAEIEKIKSENKQKELNLERKKNTTPNNIGPKQISPIKPTTPRSMTSGVTNK